MGKLSYFDLQKFITKYKSDFLIETGTFKGHSINYALKFKFKKIFSVELLTKFYDLCVIEFKNNKNVYLINDTSINGLKRTLKENKIGRTIFWLDAHLPNHLDETISSDYVLNKNLLIPLEDELKTIVENKDINMDVFIIDDLRIYERGQFKKGEWLDVINAGHS